MGDAPLKGQSELDVLCTLLKVSPEALPRAFLLALYLGFPSCQLWCRGKSLILPREE